MVKLLRVTIIIIVINEYNIRPTCTLLKQFCRQHHCLQVFLFKKDNTLFTLHSALYETDNENSLTE